MENSELRFYLHHLSAFHLSVSRSIHLLLQLSESEESLIEAFSLQARKPEKASSGTGYDTDRFHLAIKENCIREKKELDREKSLILNRIREEKKIIVTIEGAIYSLPEPMRSICVLRYVNQLRWNDVQRETDRSAASVFKIHKDALRILEKHLCNEKSDEKSHLVVQSAV